MADNQNTPQVPDNRGANKPEGSKENKHGKASVKEVHRVHTHHGATVDFENENDALDFVHDAVRNPKSPNAHLFREHEEGKPEVRITRHSFVDWGDE